eukprot:TRINITY_DN2077_c0_g1_i1.p1 TRINITY_DN2077_c0_g1~~TRINITY_DN2077_c0_g1_i1.p1  ORF type:complete len:326 (+),score=30.83 TRINITY_DN2077_c0_g1_i1:47-979(+)
MTSGEIALHKQQRPAAPPLWYSFVCGATGQCLEIVTLGHILDRIKTEQQCNPAASTVRSTAREIWRRGGLSDLYLGLRWNLLQGALKGSSRWGINNWCHAVVTAVTPEGLSKTHPSFFSGLVACTAAVTETTVLICPLESLKTLEMTIQRKPGTSASSLVLQRLQADGSALLFRGWARTLLKQTVSWFAYLVGYGKFKEIAENANTKLMPDGTHVLQPIPWHHKAMVGAATGMMSAAIHTPVEMLKTQAQKADATKSSMLVVSRQIWRAYGIRGFYVSLNAKLLRSAWFSAVTLLTMDYLNAMPAHMKMN